MPLDAGIVGRSGVPQVHVADARWTMAYAAALGETALRYFDTCAGVYAHPLFPVCLEWPAVLESRRLMAQAGLDEAGLRGAVHAAHDLRLDRPIAAGETLATTPTVVAAEEKAPGTFCTTRLDTVDAGGRLVCRTHQLTLLRGVKLHGESRRLEPAPPVPAPYRPAPGDAQLGIAVPFNAAHVYSECARIWNPIHTDRKAAVAAQLPDLILHGTMTLALAVTRLVAAGLADAARIRRVGGRFAAPVFMPSQLTLRASPPAADGLRFRLLAAGGGEAIRDGFLGWDP